MDSKQLSEFGFTSVAYNAWQMAHRRNTFLFAGLEEALAALNFIRTATKDAQIAALAGSAAAVAELYLKQAKGGTK